jgi:hypothetical protein
MPAVFVAGYASGWAFTLTSGKAIAMTLAVFVLVIELSE